MSYHLFGRYRVCKAFMSNTQAESEHKWLSHELLFPGFSRGLESWRGLVSDTSTFSAYTSCALAMFSVKPNGDIPCIGSTWNTEQVLAHFLLQSCWRWVTKIWHVEFLPYQRTLNCRMVLSDRAGLQKAGLELMRLNSVPAKCHTISRGVFPRPTLGILHDPAWFWIFLLSRFWSASITSIRRSASYNRALKLVRVNIYASDGTVSSSCT